MGAEARMRAALKNRGIPEPTQRLLTTLDDLGSIGDKASDAIFLFTEGGSSAQLMRDLSVITIQINDAIITIAKDTR